MAEQRSARGSVAIARIAGIEIRVHWTFLGLLVLVVWADASGGPRAIGAGLMWVVAIFASVLLHEFAHCVVARRRGTVVLDILLLPIGGMSQMEKIPESPRDELAMAAAGPLTSLGLAAGLFVLGATAGSRLWPPTLFAGSWLARLAWLNVVLGAFNFLPALPMDGGRILRAVLARRHDRITATRLAGRVARFLAWMMILGGLFYDLWFAVIGFFVLMGAAAEEQAAQAGEHRVERGGRQP
jgi:Zn-dependent protease